MGLLHGHDRAADAPVLAVSDQRARARDRLGAARARQHPAGRATQDFSFGWKVWLGFGYAVVGPLFLTNILWFTAIDRVGASRASLFANMQPFFAVLFALILLSESLHALEIAGGVLIFAGIAFERIARRPSDADALPGGVTAAALESGAMSEDFMPLVGWDYIEFWVGNAKQAAYFYEHAFGFTRTAYAGPETGVRDRASYVLEQGDIRFVVTSAAPRGPEIAKHHARHGDGVKEIALTVPDATEAYRQAVQRGARGVVEPSARRGRGGSLETSAIATYGDTVHTFVEPQRLHRAVQARLRLGLVERPGGGRRADRTSTTSSATSSSGA